MGSKRTTPSADDGDGSNGDHRPPQHRLPPEGIPDHQLLRRIGAGSYGEVWLARNRMGTYRAVKIVDRSIFEDERPYRRELNGIQKFEPISRSHEGFVDVLHVGINEEQGYFYYVMEIGDDCVDGQNFDPAKYRPKTLDSVIEDKGNLTTRECLELGLALSQALGEMHKRGLVHRDVKPSNIIFVNDVPKLADIGLVTDVDAKATKRTKASLVGTEGFMAPEGPGAPPADVYSLGKTLYEACTGKDRLEFPGLPTEADERPDRDLFLELNEVVITACKHDFTERYPTGWELYGDLLVLANGKSVKRLRALERHLENLKRGVGVAALIGLVLFALGFAGYREWKNRMAAREREAGASVAYGLQTMDEGDLAGALPKLAQALSLDAGNPERAELHRLRIGCVLDQCPKLTTLWATNREITCVEFSPDGKHFLASMRDYAPQIFDIESGKPVSVPLGEPSMVTRASFSPDGNRVVVTSESNVVEVWHVPEGARVATLRNDAIIDAARFSPDGRRIVAGVRHGVVKVFDAETGECQLTVTHTNGNGKGDTGRILFAGFSRDGRRIVAGGTGRWAVILDAESGRQIGPALVHPESVFYADFSPEGDMLVTACHDKYARVWDLNTGRMIAPAMKHQDLVHSAVFSPDGTKILTAGDRTARLWDAHDHQPVKPNPILWHCDKVNRALFSGDGHRIITASLDCMVRVWDLAGRVIPEGPFDYNFCLDRSHYFTVTNQELRVWDSVSFKPVSPAIPLETNQRPSLSTDGNFVMLASTEAARTNYTVVEVINSHTGKTVGAPVELAKPFSLFFVSPNGERLLALSGTNHGEFRSISTNATQATAFHGDWNMSGAAFNPAGTAVATWGGGQRVTVWDTATGRKLFEPLILPPFVKGADFSSDGSRLLTWTLDSAATQCKGQVWDATTGEAIGPGFTHSDGVTHASFDGTGELVLTSSEDGSAVVWKVATGLPVVGAFRHQDQIVDAEFSHNYKLVTTASRDTSVRVWSLATGDPLTPLLWQPISLSRVRFLPGDHFLVTLDEAGIFRKWPLRSEPGSVDEVARMASLLTAKLPDVSDINRTNRTRAFQELWNGLRSARPADFQVSTNQVAAWHEYEAEFEEVQLEPQWHAIVFHLERLLELRPDDAKLADRLAHARDKMRESIPLPPDTHISQSGGDGPAQQGAAGQR